MEVTGAELISKVILGITYITPLAVIIWRLAKADSCIKDNAEEIKNLREKCKDQQAESAKTLLLDQRLKTLEGSFQNEKSRSDRMEKSLSEIKGDLRDVSTKLDMLLKYNIQKKGNLG